MSWLDSIGHRIIRQIHGAREARLRRPPQLLVAPAVGNTPPRTVYYLCPDSDRPIGGIRTIYRHVDALNSVGVPAVLIHKRNGFSCSWFDHQTPVVGAESVRLTSADALVVPEFYGHSLDELPTGPQLVIFNQNAYRTFDWVRPRLRGRPYWETGRPEAMLVVSHDNAEYARYAFPGLRVERIRNAVDSRIFYPAASAPDRRIAVMPRRRPADCSQVLDLLAVRGCLDRWEIVSIDGRSEKETAEVLRSCAAFLSFSEQEGFGMPPAEAMACGCYVIGFTGLAGREFFDPAICTPVEEGDVLAFAKAAERALRTFEDDPQAMRRRALTASTRILAEYSLEGQRADLVAFFASLQAPQGSGQPNSQREV